VYVNRAILNQDDEEKFEADMQAAIKLDRNAVEAMIAEMG
jgi:hypothetical protein